MAMHVSRRLRSHRLGLEGRVVCLALQPLPSANARCNSGESERYPRRSLLHNLVDLPRSVSISALCGIRRSIPTTVTFTTLQVKRWGQGSWNGTRVRDNETVLGGNCAVTSRLSMHDGTDGGTINFHRLLPSLAAARR